MFRRLNLAGLVLLTLTSPAFAAEGGFTWANFLLGGLAEPLASVGIDPRPILDMIIVAAVLIGLAWWLGKPFRETQMLEPSGRLDKDHFAVTVVEGILNFLSGIIQHGIGSRPLLPLLGTYGLFILFLNLAGLIPGFNPPTDQFNITFAFAIVVFLLTHTLGIRQHGAGYIKQFIGPMPLMAPLMFPVELISHLVRPMSLSIRLLGNMTGDHKVVLIFSSILALGLPVPFMGLGILISVLQAFVFVLLSAIYFEVAMSEAH